MAGVQIQKNTNCWSLVILIGPMAGHCQISERWKRDKDGFDGDGEPFFQEKYIKSI